MMIIFMYIQGASVEEEIASTHGSIKALKEQDRLARQIVGDHHPRERSLSLSLCVCVGGMSLSLACSLY